MTHHVQGVENTGGEIFEGQSPTNTGPKNLFFFLTNKKKKNVNYWVLPY